MSGKHKIAVIGAGMAGLACARRLADGGADVTVFDKGRGLGGRIATRRGAQGAFDHGAVALSAAGGVHGPHTVAYGAFLAAAANQGAVVWWPAGQGWVGLPGMTGAVRPLAQGLAVQSGVEVTGLLRSAAGWQVQGGPQRTFDQVILAIPQPQAVALLAPWPVVRDQIAGAQMRAVWTAMARFEQALPVPGDLITRPDGPIAMAVRNSAKPGRGGYEAWVIHAAADWTATHLEREKPEAAALLLAEFFAAFGVAPLSPLTLEGHRWRYGLTARALGQAFVRDAGLGLAVCGDWCLGADAGDAYASGLALAEAVLGQ